MEGEKRGRMRCQDQAGPPDGHHGRRGGPGMGRTD